MLRRIAYAAIVASAAGLLSRLPIVATGMLRIDAAIVVIFAAAAYDLPVDWIRSLGVFSASILLYLCGAALPPSIDAVLLVTGAIFAFMQQRVPKWDLLGSASSS